ncbi:uncharacterized protein LOC122815379 [Protopterus annectens]|uniref:uncharacterized protein LOC122815379 n=1 Tax=Protopterus annectens TaxID=7888 RepID=UPI001CFBC510|nr:uncharacterized protein LOC122815379 [Protopterus annectens]
MERTNIGSKVTIECRNSQYRLKECWFHKYGDWRTHYSNSNTDSGVQYVIESVTEVDEGSYICECNSVQDESTQRSHYVTVVINQKPHIRVIPQEETRIGSKVTIECNSSNSRNNLTRCWFYKDNKWLGHLLHSSSTSAVQYVIQNATAQDEGSYTCQCYKAQNQSTETSNPVKLAINLLETVNFEKALVQHKTKKTNHDLAVYEKGNAYADFSSYGNKTAFQVRNDTVAIKCNMNDRGQENVISETAGPLNETKYKRGSDDNWQLETE